MIGKNTYEKQEDQSLSNDEEVELKPLASFCDKCDARCCKRFLVVVTGGISTGKIKILPDEVKRLLALARERGVKLVIYPKEGYGIRWAGSRPVPEVIFTYTLATSPCPFLDEDAKTPEGGVGRCTIYENRPIACRAFPLIFEGKPTVRGEDICPWVKKSIDQYGIFKVGKFEHETEFLNAQLMYESAMGDVAGTIKQRPESVLWMFNILTGEWVVCIDARDKENVLRFPDQESWVAREREAKLKHGKETKE